ncbi:MAG: hypothetical protein JSS81_11515 [Acidobacteria bacterium]|nr:hypothetical protein [Acidobacteriota bacterium]
MAQPWIDAVRKSGQLTVYSELSGSWANIYGLAIEAFNKFNLGVRLVKADAETAANVLLRQASGTAVYTYGDQQFTRPFSGTALHGYTMQLASDGKIEKAVCFLPATPQSQDGFINGKMQTSAVGQDAMLVIAVHELIHAGGLENKDHAEDGLFYFPLGLSGKKMIVPEKGKNNRPLPPLFLANSTVSKLKALW